jgi:hypothetical protein
MGGKRRTPLFDTQRGPNRVGEYHFEEGLAQSPMRHLACNFRHVVRAWHLLAFDGTVLKTVSN